MTCYCGPKVEKDLLGAMKLEFQEFEFDGLPDENLYCKEWFFNFLLEKSLVIATSVSIALINIISTFIFEKIVVFERRQTVNDETEGVFRKITWMQFINIAIVILVVNFGWLTDSWLNFLPILNGDF